MLEIDVKKYLLHREPFLFVDKVQAIADKNIVAMRHIKADEEFFKGHFPGDPVFPGVLMVEALAQAACILIAHKSKSNLKNVKTYFAGIEKTSFKRLIKPNETMILKVDQKKEFGLGDKNFFTFSGEVLVDNEIACSSSFTAVMIKTNH